MELWDLHLVYFLFITLLCFFLFSFSFFIYYFSFSHYYWIQVITSIGDDSVVINATLLVREHGETAVVGCQSCDVSDYQLFDEGDSVFSVNFQLAHV
jgi:hypothetical protein